MLLGADTSYLILLGSGHKKAGEIWESIIQGENRLVIPVLAITEYLAYNIKRSSFEKAKEFVSEAELSPSVEIVPVSLKIATLAARFRVGLGLPTVDAVILATFLESGCHLLLTTDQHFQVAGEHQIIRVEMLQ